MNKNIYLLICLVTFLAVFCLGFSITKAATYPRNLLTIKIYQENEEVNGCILENSNFNVQLKVISTGDGVVPSPEIWQLQTVNYSSGELVSNSYLNRYDSSGERTYSDTNPAISETRPVVNKNVFSQLKNSNENTSSIKLVGTSVIKGSQTNIVSVKICVVKKLSQDNLPLVANDSSEVAIKETDNLNTPVVATPDPIEKQAINTSTDQPLPETGGIVEKNDSKTNLLDSYGFIFYILLGLILLILLILIFSKKKENQENKLNSISQIKDNFPPKMFGQ